MQCMPEYRTLLQNFRSYEPLPHVCINYRGQPFQKLYANEKRGHQRLGLHGVRQRVKAVATETERKPSDGQDGALDGGIEETDYVVIGSGIGGMLFKQTKGLLGEINVRSASVDSSQFCNCLKSSDLFQICSLWILSGKSL